MVISAPPVPDYGRRLLPQVVDEIAWQNPLRVFASIPKSAEVLDGFRDVTFAEVASAVDSMCRTLREEFFEPEYEFETLTYVGVPDLRYNIVFYAAIKCGYKALLISPRNPTRINLGLMEQTKSTKIIFSPELNRLVEAHIFAKPGLRSLVTGSLELMLASKAEKFPFLKTFEQAQHHPIVVLHSSGSTGLPKPVTMTHGSFATLDTDRLLPTVPGRQNLDFTIWDFAGIGGRIYEPFPPFHLAGFYNKIVIPVFANASPVFGPPSRPPSGSLVAEIMKKVTLDGAILPPSIVEQLLHEPNGLDYFKSLGRLAYAGGPLSPPVGDVISSVTTLCQNYGSTEVGVVRQLIPIKEDWSYMEFHPLLKHELQPAEDIAFELVLFADESTEKTSAINHNFPGLSEFRTKDLFKPHPTKSNLWRFHGRRDDIIVFSTGEKFNPVPMETVLQGHPLVSGAVVTGGGRSQAALLLEPKSKPSVDSFIDSIWPTIEEANSTSPGQGRIMKSMVLVASPGKPFVRAGKGTVVRKLTESSYKAEIEALYANNHSVNIAPVTLRASSFEPGAVHEFVRSIITQGLHDSNISDEENFYNIGMDSLKTIEAADRLKTGLSIYKSSIELSWISPEVFYNFPSIEQLSRILLDFLNKGTLPGKRDRLADMLSMFRDFTKNFPAAVQVVDRAITSMITVALTGSTGSFGTQMLLELSQSDKIAKIYCLNRSEAASVRWEEAISSTGLATARCPITFLKTDLNKPEFGLQAHEYKRLQDECDFVLHTAWKVDFKQSLPSFKDNVQSVRSLIDWSIGSPKLPRIVFVSSISSVGPWSPYHKQGSIVPEGFVGNFEAALEMGYAESKAVAEHISEAAASQLKTPVSILRSGVIGGSTNSGESASPEKELFPGIIKTSKSMGYIPGEGMEDVDWIPSDSLSKIVLELSLHDLGVNTPKYYNLVNPQKVPWIELMGPIEEFCDSSAQVVSLLEWVKQLKGLEAAGQGELNSRPALKILDFFEKLANRGPSALYETKSAVNASETMRTLPAIDEKIIRVWLGLEAK